MTRAAIETREGAQASFREETAQRENPAARVARGELQAHKDNTKVLRI